MEFVRCILSLTLLSVIGYTESLELVGESSGICGKIKTLTCKVDSASPIPTTLSWLKDGNIITQCDGGSVRSCLDPVLLGNRYFTADFTKKEYYLIFNTTKLRDAGTWGCNVGSTRSERVITVETELQSGKINDTKNGFLQLDTGCFVPTEIDKITVSWECYDKKSAEWLDLRSDPKDPIVHACSASDCSLDSYKKHTKVAKFEQCDSCKLKVRAKLTYTTFSPVYAEAIEDVPIEDFNWKPYQYAVWALFIVVVLKVVLNIPWLIFHHDLLLVIVNYANYITLIWSLIMVCLIYTAGKGYCSETPDETGPLAIVSLIVSVIIRILILILLCADKMPVKQLKGYAITLKQLHCCGCQKPDKQNPGEHSHGQSTGHSDRGGDKRVGVSKQNDEHSKILMTTSGNANQQPRPQPPLPGIGKSHQPVDEPHYKNTRGLSSNFEDPNSLPQFEVRKHSLAPINATAEGDSDSTARKKKKKKKKKEGSDTARSDED